MVILFNKLLFFPYFRIIFLNHATIPGQPRRQQSHSHGGHGVPGGRQLRGDAVHPEVRGQGQEDRQPRRRQRRPQRQDHQGTARGSGDIANSTAGGAFCVVFWILFVFF